MRIRVNFLGTLSNYTGADSVEIELEDGARYGDLLAELGRRYGTKFPEKCWNGEKVEFRKPVSAISSSGDIDARETLLIDNDEIHILIPVSGG
jgi:molybdopterin converting factor small subunit